MGRSVNNYMNRPKRKLIGGIVLLAVLFVLYGCFLLVTNTAVNGGYTLDLHTARIKAVDSSVRCIRDLNVFVENREVEKYTNRIALTSVAAKGMLQNGWDGESTYYSEGAIVRTSPDGIKYPKGYPEEQKIDAADLTGAFGLVTLECEPDGSSEAQRDAWLVGYRKLEENVYYIECARKSALEERARLSFDANTWMKGIEDSFDIRVLLFAEKAEKDGSHPLVYRTADLPEDIFTAEQCGITEEILGAAVEGGQSLTADKLLDSSDLLEWDGSLYRVFIQYADGSKLSGERGYIVFLIPEQEFVTMTVEQTSVLLGAFLVLGIVLLVWFFSQIRLVRHFRLSEDQIQQLETKQTAKKAFTLIATGCVVIFIVAALLISLLRLFGICNGVKNSLGVLEQRIAECRVQEKTALDELKSTYVSYAQRMADILEERPELATKEGLQSFSDMIGADYIMLYDHEGKETLSNSDYIDMELGTSPDSSTYEFRRLLKGIPSVVHEVNTDEATGLRNAMVGVCMKDAKNPDKYGVLMIAVPENKFVPEKLETMDDVMKSLVSEGTFAFSVNPADQMIVNASENTIIGRDAVSLELPETALVDSYRDFFTMNDIACYGESKSIDGYLYYYAAERPHIYKNIFLYSGVAAGACFLFLAVLIAYMMFGYRKAFDAWAKRGEEELIERIDDGPRDNSETEHEEDPRKRWKLSLSRYGLRTPTHNATVTLEVLLIGWIIIAWIWYLINGESKAGSLMSFVLHGQWTKGLNLFSFTSILILFAEVLIVVSVLKILVHVLSSFMGSKGETFRRLTLNLLTYAGMIFFVYMALFNLGINLGALIASLSLPAFALSLGAKDLITDIVAGISIVFDGEFKVGDIIDINGYRGTVLEIGVRTTKLKGSGNNIKIIANRDVKNVVNMSRRSSIYVVDVKVSVREYRLKDVEDMLTRELPKLKDKIPGLISGPDYMGVNAIGGKNATLSIQAECYEGNYDKVRKAMNHAIQDLFDEQGIAFE